MEGSSLPFIFVYGTLRENEINHYYLKDAVCLYKQAWIYGKLFDTKNSFPVMKENKHEKIYGEVYRVTDKLLHALNELEGYQGNASDNLYEQKMVTVFLDNGRKLEALTYIAGRSLTDSVDAILPGDWKVHRYLRKDCIYYFAYGSCMDDERFRLAKVDDYFTAKVGRGILKDHGFRFSRTSMDGGKADIIESAEEVVEGIVYHVPMEAIDYLYEREGVYVNAYRPAVVQISVNGASLEAITFIGTEKSKETRPSDLYGKEIIRGAKGILSEPYIKKIEQRIKKLESSTE